MIIFDNIIENISPVGGVSVLFRELKCRLTSANHPFVEIFPRFTSRYSIERYLACRIPREISMNSAVFHSTYYRLPKARIPVVTTVHDFTYEKQSVGLKVSVHHWQKMRAILASDAVICVSENTKRDLLHFAPSIDTKKIHVVHNGVSDDYKFNDCEDYSNFVLFVGVRTGYKNFELAVLALSPLRQFYLSIVGGGPLTTAERRLLDEHLPSRYRHEGFATNKRLNDLYNQAFCLLYPSAYEGFGIPVIEAMKAGCPVIAANRSSIPEISSDAALLVDDLSPEPIRARLLSLLDNRFRHEIVEKGLTNSFRFSWDRCFEETLAVYQVFTR